VADLGVAPGDVLAQLATPGAAGAGPGPADQPGAATLLERLAAVCPVATDPGALVAAGRDWWPISAGWAVDGRVPALPSVVALPRSTAEVSAALAACHDTPVPVTPGAGRSGVCGGAVPVMGGVALDCLGLVGDLAVDPDSMLVDVPAGVFGDHLEAELRREHGLTLGHWPQSIAMSTVGGWLACRSAGQYSTRYGKIEDMVVGLEVVLADGRVVRTGGAGPRSATGPDLTQLFVGSEGTLGVITRARLRARPAPAYEVRGTWLFASFAAGLDACRRVLRRGATPAVLRLYDEVETRRSFDVHGGCLLVVVDEGDPGLVDAGLAVVADECRAAQPADPALAERWLGRRNEVASLEELARGGVVADTIEVAAPWSVLPALYREAVGALTALPPTIAASAHQSHAYTDGACLYFTFAGVGGAGAAGAGAGGWAPGAREGYYTAAWDAVSGTTLARGGSLSHHHGIGINRGRHLPTALGAGFPVLQAVKDALDPRGVLNPGKLGLASAWGPAPWPAPQPWVPVG
jgi:alkyldihydroxyacetonephosphate synthase